MTIDAQRKLGVLSQTYTGFGLTGNSLYEYHVVGIQLTNVSGTMATVDGGINDGATLTELLFGSTVAPSIPAAPIAGVAYVLGGDTLQIRASAASAVKCAIFYQRKTV
jgi:hypothetical protein